MQIKNLLLIAIIVGGIICYQIIFFLVDSKLKKDDWDYYLMPGNILRPARKRKIEAIIITFRKIIVPWLVAIGGILFFL